MKGVSIVICCYNSAARLPATLQYIAAQQVPAHIPWELLIVNNNSTDDTADVARQFFQAHPGISGEVLEEDTPGLSYARQKGFDHAQFEYIILCDDDNWLKADYTQTAFEIMEGDRAIASLGGCGTPVFETGSAPRWFNDYRDYYATGPQNGHSGDITPTRSFVYGAGAVFRASALSALKVKGFENLLTDRKGNSLVTGGDNELGYALVLSGHRIWYDERLQFFHFITAKRLTLSYFLKLARYNAYSKFLLAPYVDLIHPANRKQFKYSFAWNLLALVLLMVKDDLLRLPALLMQKRFYRFRVSLAGRMGTLKAMISHRGYQYHTLNNLKNASWYKNR